MTTDQQSAFSAPPLIIDSAHYDQLEELALSIMKSSPDLAATLLDEITRAEVRPSELVHDDVVVVGSDVTFRDEEGRVQTVRLVFPGDADISKRHVSVLTPIGAALIGLSVGQQMTWASRDGKDRILTVSHVA